jgi:hypothetical protein
MKYFFIEGSASWQKNRQTNVSPACLIKRWGSTKYLSRTYLIKGSCQFLFSCGIELNLKDTPFSPQRSVVQHREAWFRLGFWYVLLWLLLLFFFFLVQCFQIQAAQTDDPKLLLHTTKVMYIEIWVWCGHDQIRRDVLMRPRYMLKVHGQFCWRSAITIWFICQDQGIPPPPSSWSNFFGQLGQSNLTVKSKAGARTA